MSKQSDWLTTVQNPSTESIVNAANGHINVSNGHIGGVVAHHHIKTAAMWYHDYTDWVYNIT